MSVSPYHDEKCCPNCSQMEAKFGNTLQSSGTNEKRMASLLAAAAANDATALYSDKKQQIDFEQDLRRYLLISMYRADLERRRRSMTLKQTTRMKYLSFSPPFLLCLLFLSFFTEMCNGWQLRFSSLVHSVPSGRYGDIERNSLLQFCDTDSFYNDHDKFGSKRLASRNRMSTSFQTSTILSPTTLFAASRTEDFIQQQQKQQQQQQHCRHRYQQQRQTDDLSLPSENVSTPFNAKDYNKDKGFWTNIATTLLLMLQDHLTLLQQTWDIRRNAKSNNDLSSWTRFHQKPEQPTTSSPNFYPKVDSVDQPLRFSLLDEERDDGSTKDEAVPNKNDIDQSDEDMQSSDDNKDLIAKRAALLAKRKAASSGIAGRNKNKASSTASQSTTTSVGPRRIGSASRARTQGTNVAIRTLLDAARLKGLGNAAATGATKSENKNHANPKDNSLDENDPGVQNNFKSTFSTRLSVIHATINEMIEQNNHNLETERVSSRKSCTIDLVPATFDPEFKVDNGIDVETRSQFPKRFRRFNYPGAVLLSWPKTLSNAAEVSTPVLVRLSTRLDDLEIAQLRLSVFSDLSTDVSSQFCARSCQAMAQRRARGATCVVAQVGRGRIVGTAEVSFHEFIGTQLGQRRRLQTMWYITEVAVHSSFRNQGVGQQLLQGIDVLANDEGIESLYLHVDVLNDAALALYKRSGYEQVVSDDPMYFEFTKSLHLHPGAMQGRTHHLLCKNLREPSWIDEKQGRNVHATTTTRAESRLGFEVPV